MTQQRISSYEKGKREPDIETLKQFANFFGCTIDFLLGVSNTCNPEKVSHTAPSEIQSYYDELNEIGKQKAIENVSDLTKISEYTNKNENKKTESQDA